MESEELEVKLERAKNLVEGLGGERTRWEGSIASLEADLTNLVGDCLLAAAFLSYCGPFDSEYRALLVQGTWIKSVKTLNIPCAADFDFCNFLANAEDVRDWNIQGLPADAFSTENGVMVTRGTRWPLMIDPQEQANKWVKNMEKDNQLKICTLKMSDYLRTLENAIQFGQPVLMQEVEEELDPALEPIMSRAIVKVGNRSIMKLGDKEVDYNPEFRFYLTTKLANPHYTPEISTKATICNFCVKQQGLEDQLLGTVVRKERPELEQQKNELVVAVAAGKRKLVELEDTILRMLSSATGSLLDDEELVLTLQSSKTTSVEVTSQLQVSEQTERKIDAAREGYRPSAYRASILYFLLSDLARVDPMYQFSLGRVRAPLQPVVGEVGALRGPAGADPQPQRVPHVLCVPHDVPRALRGAQAALLVPDLRQDIAGGQEDEPGRVRLLPPRRPGLRQGEPAGEPVLRLDFGDGVGPHHRARQAAVVPQHHGVLRVVRPRLARVVPFGRARDGGGAPAGRVGESLLRADAADHRALPAPRPHRLRRHRVHRQQPHRQVHRAPRPRPRIGPRRLDGHDAAHLRALARRRPDEPAAAAVGAEGRAVQYDRAGPGAVAPRGEAGGPGHEGGALGAPRQLPPDDELARRARQDHRDAPRAQPARVVPAVALVVAPPAVPDRHPAARHQDDDRAAEGAEGEHDAARGTR